jgi:hypothetical protein
MLRWVSDCSFVELMDYGGSPPQTRENAEGAQRVEISESRFEISN